MTEYNPDMTETTTLETLAAQIEKGFAAVAGDIADVRREMLTKDDVRLLVREELRDVRTELRSIRNDLDDLKEQVDNITGFRKEIDHALERINDIEKHLGLNKKLAA